MTVGSGEVGGGVGSREDLGERLTGGVLGGQCLPQRGYGVLARDGDRAHPQSVGLLGEQSDPAAGGGEPGDAEAVGVAQHEVDGLGPDRPGGAEDHDIPDSVHGVEDKMRISEGAGLSLIPPLWPQSGPRRTGLPSSASALISTPAYRRT